MVAVVSDQFLDIPAESCQTDKVLLINSIVKKRDSGSKVHSILLGILGQPSLNI